MSGSPIVLFDGLCNLCNGVVAWILRHDHRGAFRFASLQSRAGRAAAERAGCREHESVVLIDEDGWRARAKSDAVIGIARRLGLPWSLAVIALVLPRPIRDAIYDVVARNRLRWFGSRQTCMVPTPELRARFLDADEPREIEPPPPAPAERRWTISGLLARVVIAYLVVYLLPFPLGVIPGTGGLAAPYENAKRATVLWASESIFGTTITYFPAGSGDTTYNYIELAVVASAALVVGLAWWWRVRGRAVGARARDLAATMVRYGLAAAMFSYGFAKLFPSQFPTPGPERWVCGVGEMSPMGLAWTFFGSSSPYQVFAGGCEVLAGLLLISRRTALAGSLVAVMVLTNVVALNFCYDIPVKLYSSHLLLMAVFLAAPHAPRLAALGLLNLPIVPVDLDPFAPRRAWARRLRGLAKAVMVASIAVLVAIEEWRYYIDEVTAPPPSWAGVYRVESFSRGGVADRALDDAERWVRVGLGASGLVTIQRADGSARRQLIAIDEPGVRATITRRDERVEYSLAFERPEPGVIVLSGEFEGQPIVARLRMSPDVRPLLTTRGFHWISELPFHR